MTGSAGTSTKYVFNQFSTTSLGVHTASVYAKAGTETFVVVRITDNTGGNAARQRFNLATGAKDGAIGVEGTVTSSSSDITAVGDGWYRCSITTTFNSALTLIQANLWLNSYANVSLTTNLFLWGAQLNVGALQPYYPTTVKNALGFTQEFDNAAWTKSNSFIQTNQIRNNTMQGAVAPSTLPTNWGGNSIGLTRTVVGVGTENGVSYIDVRFNGTTTSRFGSVTFEPVNGVAASASQAWTNSSYIKLVGGSFANVPNVGLALYYFDSGSVFLNSSASTLSPSGTLIRYSLTGTTVASTAFVQPAFYFNGANASGDAVDFTIRIGWPQLVQGAVAGDPVPTYGTAIPVQYVAPDGSVTADKLVENAANAQHLCQQLFVPVSGTKYTTVWRIKAAERSFAVFGFSGGGLGADCVMGVNLATGAVVSTSGSPESTVVVAGGNGWYTVCLTKTLPTATNCAARVMPSTDGTTQVYTGDGTSGIFIWGAQLSDSASLDPYVYNPAAAFTSTAYYGPRFDYDPATLAPRGLLIEEQRTNSIRNNSMVGAVAGTPGTLPTNWFLFTAATGLTTSVVGTGLDGGIQYVDFRVTGTASGSTVISFGFEGNTSVAALTGQAWTLSSFLRFSGGTTAGITATRLTIDERSTTAYIRSNVGGVLPVTNELQRFELPATLSGGATVAYIVPYVQVNFSTGVALDFTLRIGLPQLELGAFATSVIPTTTAAATRATDFASMLGANFTNWYSQPEGTMFVEGSVALPVSGGNQFLMRPSDNSYNNNTSILVSSTGVLQISTAAGGVFDGLAGNTTALANVTFKTAGAYKTNDLGMSSNGGTVATDPTATIPLNLTRVDFGGDHAGFNRLRAGYLRRIAYYPRRLANSELQTVTL
jgi:hypothetical protein